MSRPAPGSIQSPIQWVPALFPEVKLLGREDDHLPPFKAWVKNEWRCTPAFPPHSHGVMMENYTFFTAWLGFQCITGDKFPKYPSVKQQPTIQIMGGRSTARSGRHSFKDTRRAADKAHTAPRRNAEVHTDALP